MNDAKNEMIESLVADIAGERLDKYLAAVLPDLSRSEVQKLIKGQAVTVNGKSERASYRLEEGDVLELMLPTEVDSTVQPEDIPLTLLYEDAAIAVVDKAAGMVVHPAYGNAHGTLVNALLHHFPQVRGVGPENRFGIVHRLDKDTSGAIVIAKTQAALDHLQQQFKERTVFKRYVALVEGIPNQNSGLIDAPIGRDPKQRKRMTVIKDGRASQTRYDVKEYFQDNALLDLQLMTGRTHQIRVHLKWLGHPLVGDVIYGYRKQKISLKRLFLHAAEIHIDSPKRGARVEVTSPLPAALTKILARLREQSR